MSAREIGVEWARIVGYGRINGLLEGSVPKSGKEPLG
jgi:hypothetical protein